MPSDRAQIADCLFRLKALVLYCDDLEGPIAQTEEYIALMNEDPEETADIPVNKKLIGWLNELLSRLEGHPRIEATKRGELGKPSVESQGRLFN
jgi:hypothetical protein